MSDGRDSSDNIHMHFQDFSFFKYLKNEFPFLYVSGSTVDFRYLEIGGTLKSTLRYP